MKYVALDIETTGLDPRRHQVLELAMVYEDTALDLHIDELPFFRARFVYDELVGQPYALNMNWDLIKKTHLSPETFEQVRYRDSSRTDGTHHITINPDLLENVDNYTLARPLTPVAVWGLARQWLDRLAPNSRHNAAGKNAAGFDLQFFPDHVRSKFRSRVIDPGSVFIDWTKSTAPGLGDLTGRKVAHTALTDALDVIDVLRQTYDRRPS